MAFIKSILTFVFVLNDLKAAVRPINEEVRLEHSRAIQADADVDLTHAAQFSRTRGLNHKLYAFVRKNLRGVSKRYARNVTNTLIEESERYNFDPVFFAAVIMTESAFNSNAKGLHGEIGLMQLRPNTAKWISEVLGQKWQGEKTLKDPVQNVKLGISYFAYLSEKFDNSPSSYVNAYNMGPKKVTQLISGHVRPKVYSQRVLAKYDLIYKSLSHNGKYEALAKKID